MKSFNFWRSLFFSALAVMAFSACSDDDDNGSGDVDASITVNGEKAAVLGIKGEGGETEAVSVVSSGAWTLAFETEQNWCTASATAGNGGTSTLTFTVAPLPADVEERSVTAVLSTPGQVFGVPYNEEAKITIQQSASGEVVTPVLIYKETFGTDANVANTNVDKYTDWTKTGEGAADVTYVGTNVSVRKSNPNNSTSYEGASAAPILFFGATPASFIVQNITLTPEQTRLQLTFGGQQTINYDTKDYTWSNTNLLVALSADGTTWSTLEYTTSDGDQNSEGKNWVLATADVTLKAPTDKLFIRFLSPILASNVRIDDITLQTGMGGQIVDLEAGDPVPTVTISEITAAGDYKVENASVVGVYNVGFVMKDATGAMLVFLNAAPEVAVGDVVSVKGTVASYGGALQFGAGAVVEKTGTAEVPAVTPVAIAADNIGGYMTKPVVTFVKMTGTLVKSGNYYNVEFPFESNYTGSISSPIADLNIDTFVGNLVDIEGWFVNNGNAAGTGSYFTVVATKVANNTDTPALNFTTTPENFAASNPEAQTIEFTIQNFAADQVPTFEFTGENADKFDVQQQGATSVTIIAVGNNDSNAAYTATLVASYNGTELDKLEVKQAYVPSGAGYTQITSAADLTAGDYYLGGYGTAEKTLQLFTGKLQNSHGVTSAYSYVGNQLSTEGTEAAIVTLEAVDGGYKIKVGEKYLIATKAGTGGLALDDSSDAHWTFSDASGIVKQDIRAEFSGVANAGVVISITAGSNVLRSWNMTGTSDANGLVFFKAN